MRSLLPLLALLCGCTTTTSPMGKADLSVLDGPRAVGQPCVNDGDCATTQCLSEANKPGYVGGYCTILGCSAGCPAGSDCLGGGGIGNTACFARCSSVADCRAGYHCCGVATDGGTPQHCAPPTAGGLGC